MFELNIESFPVVPEGQRPRKIFVDFCNDFMGGALTARGYNVIPLLTLPRGTQQENHEFFVSLLQGVTDGTIEFSRDRQEATHLYMKNLGMLAERSMNLNLSVKADGKDIKSILEWGSSRHTIQGTTTIVDPRQIEKMAAHYDNKGKKS